MNDFKPTPSEAAMRRIRSNEKKFAKQSLLKTCDELSRIQDDVAQTLDNLRRLQKELAVRIERTERDISRFLGGDL